MKTIKTTIAILALLIFTISCSKNDDKPAEIVNDCISKNYGVVSVKYTNLTEKHAIDITKTGNPPSYSSKITAAGIANDTIHLKPGNYILNISRIDNGGAAIETHPAENCSVIPCSNKAISTQI